MVLPYNQAAVQCWFHMMLQMFQQAPILVQKFHQDHAMFQKFKQVSVMGRKFQQTRIMIQNISQGPLWFIYCIQGGMGKLKKMTTDY